MPQVKNRFCRYSGSLAMNNKAAPRTAMPKETAAAHIQAVPWTDKIHEKKTAAMAIGSPSAAGISGGKFRSEWSCFPAGTFIAPNDECTRSGPMAPGKQPGGIPESAGTTG